MVPPSFIQITQSISFGVPKHNPVQRDVVVHHAALVDVRQRIDDALKQRTVPSTTTGFTSLTSCESVASVRISGDLKILDCLVRKQLGRKRRDPSLSNSMPTATNTPRAQSGCTRCAGGAAAIRH